MWYIASHDSGVDFGEAHERTVVADVVDEHVDAAVVARAPRRANRLDLGRSSRTSTTWARTVPPAASISATLALGALGIDLGDLDEGAVLGEEAGDGAADAVAAAGDDGDLAVEQALLVGDRGDVGRFLGHGRTLPKLYTFCS